MLYIIRKILTMKITTPKTATFPPLRVAPDLRKAVESVLLEDESLSRFAEKAIRSQVALRQAQAEFISRGLASRNKARETGEYILADEVTRKLQDSLDKAKQAKK